MIFSPKLQTEPDLVESGLRAGAQYLLISLVLLTPLLFVPLGFVSLSFTKSYAVFIGVLSVLVLYGLSVLRQGAVRIVAPYLMAPLWLLAVGAVASALLSGDRLDALYGDLMQTQTASFFVLLALLMTVTATVVTGKRILMHFLLILVGSTFLLQLWHVVRLLWGPEFLSLGVFASNTASPIGSFNDVAIFSGLVIVMSIVALVQLPLRRLGYVSVASLIGMSLLLLSVINFFIVWLIVGFFSLLTFLYVLTKDRLLTRQNSSEVPKLPTKNLGSVIAIGVVCVFSILYIVAGTYLGSVLSARLGVEYTEVRPSFTTSLDILTASYRDDNAFLGIGPNRFEDAWRTYKNPVINQTIFWNANFTAGSSYAVTLFVTLGIMGGICFLLFLASLCYISFKMLVTAASADVFWYFMGTVSVTAALYLWGLTLLYVPGTTMLLLAAFWTGLVAAAYAELVPKSLTVVTFVASRARTFVLIALVLIVVTGSIAGMYVGTKQFAAHLVYADALSNNNSPESIAAADSALVRAANLFRSDVYISEQVRLRFTTLGPLLSMGEPTANDMARFQTSAVEALTLARQAVSLDPTNPANHALLGIVYGVLAITQVENAQVLSTESFSRAKEFDPQNPEYDLVEAQLATRLGDLEQARAAVVRAITLKNNYVDALYLLSQLDAAGGNTVAAIATARSLVQLEPQNPAQYFQLGSLLIAGGELAEAAVVLQSAITYDQNFANARYLLALVYLEQDKQAEALVELKIIQKTNQENETLSSLIGALEAGENVDPGLGITPPVKEATVTTDNDGVTTSQAGSDTELIVPVNRSGQGRGSETSIFGSGSEDDTAPSTSVQTDTP